VKRVLIFCVKRSRLIWTGVIAILLSGCATGTSLLGHQPALGGQTRIDLTNEGDIASWKKYYEEPTSEASRREYRNMIIRRLMRLDDESFNTWSQNLYGARSVGSSIADFAQGLMGAFAAATGGSTAQSLGLAIAGVSGARSAVDKNIFLQQTADALIAKMQENRAKVDAQISQYLRQNTADYPLEQGLRDIIRYYEAGTLATASQSLQADAKVAQRGAQGVVESMKGDEVIAPAEIARARFEPQLPTRSSENTVSSAQLQDLMGKALHQQDIVSKMQPALDAAHDTELALAKQPTPTKPNYEDIMRAGGATDADIALGKTKPAFSTFVKQRAEANDTAAIQRMVEAAKKQMP